MSFKQKIIEKFFLSQVHPFICEEKRHFLQKRCIFDDFGGLRFSIFSLLVIQDFSVNHLAALFYNLQG